VWNRIPDDVRARIITLALDQPELSPRELAVRTNLPTRLDKTAGK
jgi:putative transposase